jgi:hypothetical protein
VAQGQEGLTARLTGPEATGPFVGQSGRLTPRQRGTRGGAGRGVACNAPCRIGEHGGQTVGWFSPHSPLSRYRSQ